MPTAYAARDFSEAHLWRGEVEDFTFDWSPRMQYSARGGAAYGVTATGANGSGWSAVGETASAYDFYVPSGLSALASGLAQQWSAYPTASASGSASASALVAVRSTVRLSATGAPGVYGVSARLRTSSGRELREVFTARIQG